MRSLCGHGLLITVFKSNYTKVMFSQSCVIPSVHRVGGYPSMQGGGGCVYPSIQLGRGCLSGGVSGQRLSGQGVSGQGCLPRRVSAQGCVFTTQQRWPLKRAVHIILECIRVLANSCKSKKSNGASIG